MFWQLSRLRTTGFGGAEALQPATILDWCRATGERLCSTEIDIIMAMDAGYQAACHRESAAAKDGEG